LARERGSGSGFDAVSYHVLCGCERESSSLVFQCAAESSGTAIGTIKPDYLGGSSMHAMHCGAGGVTLGGVWQLVKYDADLSSYGTGRGIHVG
jgi:hypothetical protein